MQRVICSLASVLLLGLVAIDGRTPTLEAAAATADGAHAYFDALVARPEHWKSFSLRDQKQLATRAKGGYAHCNTCPLNVTYAPGSDPDPRRQDAAKVVIPAGKASLPNQVRLPMGTTDGAAYLVTWDAWYGAEYAFSSAGIPRQKTFQFASDGVWLEIQTRYQLGKTMGLAQITARGYSGGSRTRVEAFGPNVTDTNPMLPQVGTFTLQPERWTRYWVLIDQRKSDWDLASVWLADAQTDPVQILDRLQLNAVNGTIRQFWLEYNTSREVLLGRGPVVSYFRNLVMLRNVVNPTSLLQRPNAGTPLPSSSLAAGMPGMLGLQRPNAGTPLPPPPPPMPPRPSAPRNLRIIPPVR